MNGELLGRIGSPADVKALDPAELPQLCADIRSTLVAYGKAHGGAYRVQPGGGRAHRGDSPRLRLAPATASSSTSRTRAMCTRCSPGRAQAYLDPDRYDEVTGFTNPEESEHDQFVLGHTGTSISLACGLAKTRDMMGGLDGGSDIGNVIAVIGDGSLSSAIAFEGLNNAAAQGRQPDRHRQRQRDVDRRGFRRHVWAAGPGCANRAAHRRAQSVPRLRSGLPLCRGRQQRGCPSWRRSNRSRTSTIPIVLHVHHAQGIGGWTPRTRRPGSSRAAARRTTGRIRCPPPTACPGRASITARWRCGRWRSGSPRSRAWSSSPPRHPPGSNGITRAFRERAGAPLRGHRHRGGACGRLRLRYRQGPAGVRCWPRRPRSSSAPTTSCSRSWP